MSERIVQLRTQAGDGKQRLTDAADAETMLRIIQSIPSPRAEPFKAWMARVGAERLEELENPAFAVGRLRQSYKQRGSAAALSLWLWRSALSEAPPGGSGG